MWAKKGNIYKAMTQKSNVSLACETTSLFLLTKGGLAGGWCYTSDWDPPWKSGGEILKPLLTVTCKSLLSWVSLRTTILPQFTTVYKIIQTFSFLGKLIVTTINTTMQEGNVTTWTTFKIRLVAIAILWVIYSYFREMVRTMQRIHKPSIIPLTIPLCKELV